MIKGFVKFCKKKCWLNFVRENIHPDVNFNVCNGLEHSNLPETFCTRAIPLCVPLYIVAIVQRQLKSRCVHIVKSWIFILTEKKKKKLARIKKYNFWQVLTLTIRSLCTRFNDCCTNLLKRSQWKWHGYRTTDLTKDNMQWKSYLRKYSILDWKITYGCQAKFTWSVSGWKE